jgi:NADH dehydrogenase FAD-containing subunit
VLVIGARLTGIEVATEMPGRLRAAVAEALKALHVETRSGISVTTIDAGGVTLLPANASTPER